MLKNPCWPHCEEETPQKTCRATCERWAGYEAEKFSEYEEKQKEYEQKIAYQEAIDLAITRMKRGKRKP